MKGRVYLASYDENTEEMYSQALVMAYWQIAMKCDVNDHKKRQDVLGAAFSALFIFVSCPKHIDGHDAIVAVGSHLSEVARGEVFECSGEWKRKALKEAREQFGKLEIEESLVVASMKRRWRATHVSVTKLPHGYVMIYDSEYRNIEMLRESELNLEEALSEVLQAIEEERVA